MVRLRARRRVTAWIATLAVLLTALAPAVSQALSSGPGTSWVEVCSAQGVKWVQPGSQSAPAVPAAARLLDHCPLCSNHTSAIGMPPAAPAELAVDAADVVPPTYVSAPRMVQAWAHARPRAPPSRS